MTPGVGILHYTAPPVVGGVEVVLAHHARLMAAAGHAVRIVAGRGRSRDPRIELVRLPLADARHPRVRRLRAALDAGGVPGDFAAIVDELAGGLREVLADLDVVVAHNVCSLHFNLALTAALRRIAGEPGTPRLIAWQHDVAATSPRHATALHPGHPWELLRAPWPGVRYVAISEPRRLEVAMALGVAPAAVTVVPNGIDVDAFLGLHAATRRRLEPLRLGSAHPIVLVPARVTPRKNLELAVRVVAALRRDGDDARLIVTGPPDPHDTAGVRYLGRLRRLARDLDVERAVHFLGEHGQQTPPRVVADLYRVADVLLLPSRDEGFGLPILEAAACRLPIVCADIPPLRDLAGDDAAYIDPAADPGAVAAVVRDRVGSAAPSRFAARVRAEYGWDAVYARRIEPLLAEVAAGR